jgi:hypothetical protein
VKRRRAALGAVAGRSVGPTSGTAALPEHASDASARRQDENKVFDALRMGKIDKIDQVAEAEDRYNVRGTIAIMRWI